MSFLFPSSPRAPEHPKSLELNSKNGHDADVYQELVSRRPALLEEKLKLHARIIDEFNLTLLEKLPRDELVRQVNSYVANYVRTEKVSLNQKELGVFSEEIIDETTGYGPIEPLLKDPTVTDMLINTHRACASSERSLPVSAAGSTSPRPWSMRVCRMARA
jgi:hypothetical protein